MKINTLMKIIGDYTWIQIALNKLGRNVKVDGEIGKITKKEYKLAGYKSVNFILDELMSYYIIPPDWVRFAFEEIGTKEIKGIGSNPSVEKYHHYAGISWAKDDIAWCASFITYCMIKSGINNIPKHPASSLNWLKFGKKLGYPAYGALAIKKRKGGGHITIVVGSSPDGKYFYGLGGNQNDRVCMVNTNFTIHRYANYSVSRQKNT